MVDIVASVVVGLVVLSFYALVLTGLVFLFSNVPVWVLPALILLFVAFLIGDAITQ